MKTKDIKVGEEYAAAERTSTFYPDRVRVLEVGAERPLTDWKRRNETPRNDGIRVVILDRETGEHRLVEEKFGGTRKMVHDVRTLRAQDIRSTWTDYVAETAAAEKARAEYAAARDARAKADGARLTKVLSTLSDDVRLPYEIREPAHRNQPGSVSFSKGQLADLLEAVAAAAHRRALGG